MLAVLKFLVFAFVIKNAVTEEVFRFSTAEDFIKFLEDWTKSGNAEDFRRIQSKFMKQLMNTSADPCESFNDYACGNFNSISPAEVGPEDTFETTIEVSEGFSRFMSTGDALKDDIENESDILVKLNNFYRSCMSDDAWKPEVAGKFIKSFADWPILQNERPEEEFDWIAATARASLHECITLFRHKMTERNGSYYDSIEAAWASVPPLEELRNYSRAVGIDLTGKERELSDLLSFLNEIHKLTTYATSSTQQEFHSISDLQKLYPKFDILRYLQIIRGSEAVSPDTIVHIDNSVHFRKLYDLITSTDNEIVANAILVKIVTGTPAPRTDHFHERRKDICGEIASWPFLPGQLFQFADDYLGRDIRKNVKHLTMDIVDAADRLNPHSAVRNIKRDLIFPLSPEFTQFFMDFYQKIDIDPNDFYSNYFKTIPASVWLRTRYIDRIRVRPNSYRKYFPIQGIVVPLTMLVPPVYHRYAPNYVKFGALGSYIGHQIYKETTEDKDAYKRSVECLSSPSFSYNSSNGNIAPCAATEGLKISVSAYKKWMDLNENQESTGIEVDGTVLDGLQGLFLAHAQSICARRNKDAIKSISESYSNLATFKDAFHCHAPNLS